MPDFAAVLKFNQYHDRKTGRFTSRSAAVTRNPHRHPKSGQFTTREIAAQAAQHKAAQVSGYITGQSPGGPLRSRLTPTKTNTAYRSRLSQYMSGYSSKLRNPREKAYVVERIRQMVAGETRPHGMSKKYGLSKKRVRDYEGLTYSIFQQGRKQLEKAA